MNAASALQAGPESTRVVQLLEVAEQLDAHNVRVESWALTREDVVVVTAVTLTGYQRAAEVFGGRRAVWHGMKVRVVLSRRTQWHGAR